VELIQEEAKSPCGDQIGDNVKAGQVEFEKIVPILTDELVTGVLIIRKKRGNAGTPLQCFQVCVIWLQKTDEVVPLISAEEFFR
jgi:hypothetical protein